MSNFSAIAARVRALLVLGCALAFLSGVPALFARDAFVMLSGGVSPFANNYSQYLQARAVVAYFDQNFPRESIWAFFGAGNVEGRPPVFCDVLREVKRDGISVNSWLPGALPHNRPARRELILRALKEEILPAIADGGTLYLFVGDHGSQARANGDSAIDLWSLDRDTKSERGWRPTRDEQLTVTELRRVLATGIGKGRVVFCMTQCHSGGFHHLAVPREMTPDAKWFTSTLPSWALPKTNQIVFARAAGFTATDERSLAAGCQPDPDPQNWAGYERYVTEQLFGMNLFTLARTGKGLRSFNEAHQAATLVDQTIDKPFSTSEAYLERWASLIDTRLMKSTNLTDSVKKAVAAYQRTVDGAAPKEVDRAFRQRQTLFRDYTERLTVQNPSLKDLLLTGKRKDLEVAAGFARGSNQPPFLRPTNTPPTGLTNRPPTTRPTNNAASDTVKLWNETLRPAWQAAVRSNAVNNVVGAAVDFEKYILSRESRTNDFFSSASRGKLQEEAFWRAGYSAPENLDYAKAEAVIQWSLTRRPKIVAWARTSGDEAVRTAAETLWQRSLPRTNAPSLTVPVTPARTNDLLAAAAAARVISKKIAAERVLFYRRTLAAWEFLIATNNREALAQLRDLTELESTPLPSARAVVKAVPAGKRQ